MRRRWAKGLSEHSNHRKAVGLFYMRMSKMFKMLEKSGVASYVPHNGLFFFLCLINTAV